MPSSSRPSPSPTRTLFVFGLPLLAVYGCLFVAGADDDDDGAAAGAAAAFNVICFTTDRPWQSFPTTLSFTFFPSFKRLGYFFSISCTTLAWSTAVAAAAAAAAESAPGSFFCLASGGEILVELQLAVAVGRSMLLVES